MTHEGKSNIMATNEQRQRKLNWEQFKTNWKSNSSKPKHKSNETVAALMHNLGTQWGHYVKILLYRKIKSYHKSWRQLFIVMFLEIWHTWSTLVFSFFFFWKELKLQGTVFFTYVYDGFFSLSHVGDDPIRDNEEDEVFWTILY